MENKERRAFLRAEIKRIELLHEAELKPLKEELNNIRHVFTRRQLIDSGWVLKGFYAAGVEDIYQKNGKEIFVFRQYDYDKRVYINTGPDDEVNVLHRDSNIPHAFQDLEELNEFSK